MPSHSPEAPIPQIPLPFRKLRIALKTGEEVRPVCWLDCVGDNVHWGPTQDRVMTGHVTEREGGCTIDFKVERPADVRLPLHVSFHETGQYHVRHGSAMTGVHHLRPPRDLSGPFRLGSIVTGRGSTYPVSHRSPTRRGGRVLQIETPANKLDHRHYFEFIICPMGTFTLPVPLLKIDVPEGQHLIACAAQLTDRVALIIRQGLYIHAAHEQMPDDVELWAMRTGGD
jgi:hypothetical protein